MAEPERSVAFIPWRYLTYIEALQQYHPTPIYELLPTITLALPTAIHRQGSVHEFESTASQTTTKRAIPRFNAPRKNDNTSAISHTTTPCWKTITSIGSTELQSDNTRTFVEGERLFKSQMPSILTDDDKETVKRQVPKAANKIQAVAVARLYVAYPNRSKWTYTGLQGAAVLANDLVGNTYWLKLVDISVRLPSSLSLTE